LKKLIGIALVLAVVASLTFGGAALAYDPPNTVTMDWGDSGTGYGSGSVEATVVNGADAVASFATVGAGIRGSFSATDQNDDTGTYGLAYGFDDVSSQIKAEVIEGGYIWNKYEYTDGYPGCGYGPAGQWAYGAVSVSGSGSYGALALKHSSNYADMDSYNYGWYTPDQPSYGHQFAALNTTSYYIERSVYGGIDTSDDWASVWASGSGDATLGCAYAMDLRVNHLSLGWGSAGNAYWYTAEFLATGAGEFNVGGVGNESVQFHRYFGGLNDLGSQAGVTLTQSGYFSSLDASDPESVTFNGPASWQISADYTSSLDVDNYGMTVK